MKELIIKTSLLKNNDEVANQNRERFKINKTLAINLLGSPGSGKTSVLENILIEMKKYKVAVIEGDLYTTKDGKRIENQGVEVVQVNTAGGCHLDATMIDRALKELDESLLQLLIIENVGNLVCPASFDLGEDIRVVVMSVTEGNDKPLKYPSMFQKAHMIILNKIDLIELTNFDKKEFYSDIGVLNREAIVIEASCTKGEGVNAIGEYLIKAMKKKMCTS